MAIALVFLVTNWWTNMAEKRMFSKRIINSAKFLKMPISSQCLYFHLGLQADDDGVVEAFIVMRSIGATDEDLKVLSDNGYITILNDDLVTYINDWCENNKIRADRKIDSMYKDLLLEMLPNIEIIEKKERSDNKKSVDGQPMDNQWTVHGRSMDNQQLDCEEQMDRIGKDRLGKDRLGKEKESVKEKDTHTSKPSKHKHGDYQNVLLTDEEYDKLHKDFTNANELITFLDEYIEMKGYKAKSHYLAIRKWVVDAVKERKQKHKPPIEQVTSNPFAQMLMERQGISNEH